MKRLPKRKIRKNGNKPQKAAPKARPRRKKSKGTSLSGFFLVLCCFALAAAVIASFAGVFKVKKVELYGESPYSREEILSAAAVGVGQNIITISEQDINSRIIKKLPYVEKASVSRNIDGTLSVTVSPAKVSFCAFAPDGYYIVSDGNRVLQKSAEPQEGFMIIKGLCQSEESVGKTLKFDDSEIKKIFESLKFNLKAYKLDCDYIDMTDKMNITFRINGKFIVQLGSVSNADGKFKHLGGILEKLDEDASGVINLQLWTKNKPEGYFRQSSIDNYFENN